MPLKRREFLKLGSAAALLGSAAGLPATTRTAAPAPAGSAGGAGAAQGPADYTLRIGTGPDRNGAESHRLDHALQRPVSRTAAALARRRRAVVDIHNDTDTPELVHWHGQPVPSEVDGAAEEGTPFVPADGMRRVAFAPEAAGFRFYHTHVVAGADLNRGTYTRPRRAAVHRAAHEPGAYDREFFLVLKEFEPSFSRGGDMAQDLHSPGSRLPRAEAASARKPTRGRHAARATKSVIALHHQRAACSATANRSG